MELQSRSDRAGWDAALRWVFPVVLLVVIASAAQAQRSHVGPRIGVNFDGDDVLIGGQFTVPIAGRLEFYPSLDIYLPDDGSLLGFNGDLKYRFPTGEELQFYAGGGFNYLYRSVDGESDGDVGVNLLGGFETRRGWIHPFVEGRVLFHDNSSFQLVGGLNFTIGRH